MVSQNQPDEKYSTRVELPLVCPDYDEDCLTFTQREAEGCFNGFRNNKHLMESGLFGLDGFGRAEGYCPIITNLN